MNLPPLPEWSKMDDLGGLLPSDIRTALREYATAAVLAAQQVQPLTDACVAALVAQVQGKPWLTVEQLIRAVEAAHGIKEKQ